MDNEELLLLLGLVLVEEAVLMLVLAALGFWERVSAMVVQGKGKDGWLLLRSSCLCAFGV